MQRTSTDSRRTPTTAAVPTTATPTTATPTTAAPTTIEIDHLMAGADVIHVGEEQLALGFPEEVVKAWIRGGKHITAWLVPDVRSAAGVVQWALEFPLYHALFFQGCFAQRRRIPVYVLERDWADVLAYLELSLLGLDAAGLAAAGVAAETAAMLLAETAHLALKHPDGGIARVADFFAPRFFDAEGVVEAGALRIKRHGDNTYSFFTAGDRLEEHRLAPATGAELPYAAPLPAASAPIVPQPFEVVALGTSHGFDPAGPCTSVAVQVGGRFLLVDAGPYVRATLRHAGIAPSQLSAVIVTHAHEDHAVGLSALLGLTRRPRLFATRETAAILRRKLAILNPDVASPLTLLDDAFQLTLVRAGEEVDHLGLRLRFHYTLHSIPCVGVELALRDGAGTLRRVLFVGDNTSRAAIERAAAAGVLAAPRLEELRALYRWGGELVLADAGGGLIHGAPGDFRDCPAAQVVLVHAGALPDEERGLATLAAPGHRYTLLAEQPRPSPLERGTAYQALAEAFPALDHDALSALLDTATALSVNRGQVVVREGDATRDCFVALSGELEVLVRSAGRARRVAVLQAGEIFGEMAAVREAPRAASVVAATSARLVRLPGEAFRRCAVAAGLIPALPELWRARADLDRVAIFAGASVTTRNALARRAVRRSIEAGATLIREGSSSTTVYVLVAGRAQVYRGSEPLLVGGTPVILDPGAVLGETAPFLAQPRNASIVTVDDCEVLAIRGAEFKQVVQRSPELHYGISQVVRARQAA